MNHRVIADIGSKCAEILLLTIGGIHGNETEGVSALEIVAKEIRSVGLRGNCRFIALRGNLSAMSLGVRYLQDDMNRLWYAGLVDRLAKEQFHPEYKEIQDILGTLEILAVKHHTKKFFLDLHCTSAKNGTFLIVQNSQIARAFLGFTHFPIVLGLHDQLFGTALNFFEQSGYESVAFEGGEIGANETVLNHQQAIWQTLNYIGAVSAELKSVHSISSTHLSNSPDLRPSSCFRVVYVHKIETADNFVMDPGYANFDEVKIGQCLAKDKNGVIYAPKSGRLLMPLYQKKGKDGFFIVQAVDI